MVATGEKKLARYPFNGRTPSLRDIAAELEARGHLNERGKPFAAKSVASMLASWGRGFR
jgi:hypothetical protein